MKQSLSNPAIWSLASLTIIAIITLAYVNSASHSIEKLSNVIETIYSSQTPIIKERWKLQSHKIHPSTISTQKSFFPVKSPERKLIETGYKLGANRIGDNLFNQIGIKLNVLDSVPANTDNEKTLVELGRLAAITTLLCIIDPKNQELENIYASTDNILREIPRDLLANFSNLMASISNGETRQARICSFNNALISYISE